jgi:hypothetical protein
MGSRLVLGTLVLLAFAFSAGACRGVLGVDDLPPEAAVEAGAAGDAAAPEVGAKDDSASPSKRIDPAWAAWRVPPDVRAKFEVSEGVARDVVTHLRWQRTGGAPAVWDASERYCADLNLGGEAGWRLPTRIELLSLMDLRTPSDGNPFAAVFLDPQWNCYWTISSDADRAHWLLVTDRSQLGISTRDDLRCVPRCVQGPPYDPAVNVPPDYVISGGTVQDPLTHLEWQAYESASAGQSVRLDEASRRCTALRLGEHADWRLPTLKELATLVDERRILPTLDPRVAGESSVYWSSTPHDATASTDGGATPLLAWRVSFSDGSPMPSDDGAVFPAGVALVRCVRVF